MVKNISKTKTFAEYFLKENGRPEVIFCMTPENRRNNLDL